jgi:dTDP-4-amino-4,6-dideoxygalactose transaminase
MPDPIPLMNLQATDAPLREAFLEALGPILENTAYIGGTALDTFEAAMAERVGVKHAVGLNSGTDALIFALLGAGVKPGDGVVVPAFTYNATAAAVARAGARPVIADVDPHTLNLDPQALLSAANAAENVTAAIPVHLFGLPADMDGCRAAAESSGVTLIEDACQAIGATYKGAAAGALAKAAAFSFYPTKNLGGAGDGGLLTTDDDGVADLARTLRNQGVEPGTDKYRHAKVGWNSRLDAMQAAVLNVKLPHLDGWNDGRRAAAQAYADGFAAAGLDDAVRCPPEPEGYHHVYHLFTVRAERRDELQAHLQAAGIGCAVYYVIPLHLQPVWSELGYGEGDFPVSEAASREMLSLPCWPGLPQSDIDRVVKTIAEFYGT